MSLDPSDSVPRVVGMRHKTTTTLNNNNTTIEQTTLSPKKYVPKVVSGEKTDVDETDIHQRPCHGTKLLTT
jgi:hypothetical protein